MKYVETRIRQLEIMATIGLPDPPSRRSVLLSSTSLSASGEQLAGRASQERKRGVLRRWLRRDQGATYTLNAGAAYWR